jgi:hypothetical protein
VGNYGFTSFTLVINIVMHSKNWPISLGKLEIYNTYPLEAKLRYLHVDRMCGKTYHRGSLSKLMEFCKVIHIEST